MLHAYQFVQCDTFQYFDYNLHLFPTMHYCFEFLHCLLDIFNQLRFNVNISAGRYSWGRYFEDERERNQQSRKIVG